jgi:subtilisin family serine protease
MKHRAGCTLIFLILILASLPAAADGNFIVRTPSDQAVETQYSLTPLSSVPPQNIFLMQSSDATPQQQVLSNLKSDARVRTAESNAVANVPETAPDAQLNQSATAISNFNFDPTPTNYFGDAVPASYVNQRAAARIGLRMVQNAYSAAGAGIVAIIDTGVDPTHPALQGALVPGYDFTRNQPGIPSELNDLSAAAAAMLNQSTAAILDTQQIVVLNQSTAAILDQSTAAILDPSQFPAAFGHGTMVAGIVHLTAPNASIMPLKAFNADGTASLFDIIRAVYYAVDNGANVINLSFNLTAPSTELARAISYAVMHNVIVVASAGNSATASPVFPAGNKQVIGVASVDRNGVLSAFSNYGSHVVDLAAPGERIITTYPGNHYAAAWGTSFSAPFVSGGAALLEQFKPGLVPHEVLEAFSDGNRGFTLDLGYGPLNLVEAVEWVQAEIASPPPNVTAPALP